MTKKLRRKMKRISLASLGIVLGAVTVGVMSTSSFVVQKEEVSQELLEDTENVEIIAGENASVYTANAGANVASDGAIICDSLVQGARDNDLADGNYTFRVTARKHN